MKLLKLNLAKFIQIRLFKSLVDLQPYLVQLYVAYDYE